MIFTVLLQGFAQLFFSVIFLIPLCFFFAAVSIFSNGNAIDQPRIIFITGASSGLGKGLAIKYAREGAVIGITGRSAQRLADVKRECENRGAKVIAYEVDVLDRQKMESIIRQFDSDYHIDILIANAGISGGTSGVNGDENYYSIVETNILGVLNTVIPVIDRMKNRRRGQIVVIGSIASRIGLVSPQSGAYSASKLAVESLAYSWRTELKPYSIGVTLIAPGFVATPMTDANDFYMPFMYSLEDACKIMVDDVSKDYALSSFPSSLYVLSWCLEIFPANIVSPFFGFIKKKEGIIGYNENDNDSDDVGDRKERKVHTESTSLKQDI